MTFDISSADQPARIVEPPQERVIDGELWILFYEVDVFEPAFTFVHQTPSTSEASDWLETEKRHLARHAVPVC